MSTNPQAAQMADESMLRTLAAQIEAIWPQEGPLLRDLRPRDVLDLGSGPGHFLVRAHELWPEAALTAIDIDAAHLERIPVPAERWCRDALEPLPEARWDLTVCRHVVQAVPHPERVIANLARATRPGGRVHVVAEDYGLITFHGTTRDMDEFWQRTAIEYGRRTGSDMRIGRRAAALLREAGLVDIGVHYVVVDTLRVPRATFARIWEAWRDGYSDIVADTCGLDRAWVAEGWRQMIDCLRDPRGYACWHVPVVWGTRPG